MRQRDEKLWLKNKVERTVGVLWSYRILRFWRLALCDFRMGPKVLRFDNLPLSKLYLWTFLQIPDLWYLKKNSFLLF